MFSFLPLFLFLLIPVFMSLLMFVPMYGVKFGS